MTLSPGKYRHLGQASTREGHFVTLAIDHRANLWDSLAKAQATPLTNADFVGFKRDVLEALAPAASSVLTDPQYGAAPGIAEGYLPTHAGLLLPLEVTNYTLHPSERAFRRIPGWSVEKIKRIGGAGVKLLLYYHPEAENATAQREVVARTVEECERWDIPLYLEPIAFSPDAARPLSPDELREVVIGSAQLFCGMGIDVLKTEFPIAHSVTDVEQWRAPLSELDAACRAHGIPWALLSAGVDWTTFLAQASAACEAGASGVIVGRALWTEAVALQNQARHAFLNTIARDRITQLRHICQQTASSWRDRVAPPVFAPDSAWMEAY